MKKTSLIILSSLLLCTSVVGLVIVATGPLGEWWFSNGLKCTYTDTADRETIRYFKLRKDNQKLAYFGESSINHEGKKIIHIASSPPTAAQ